MVERQDANRGIRNDSDDVADAELELPIRLISGETTPLYLQIVHQLKQLIITHQLDDGARLPAVRRLAERLAINPGTVVQAYRELGNEGLLESVRGRGTVVRRLSGRSDDELSRARLLDAAAAELTTRASALGFSADEVRAQVNLALLGNRQPVPVAFVGWDVDQAGRYAGELDDRYREQNLRFVPFGIDDVVKAPPQLLDQLRVAYTVVTFVTMAPEVERGLAAAGIEAEIVGITVSLSAETVTRMRAMSSDRRYTLVTEQRAVTTALATIELESGIGHDAIGVVATTPDGTLDPDELDRVVAGDSVLIYTWGVHHEIAARDLPADRLLEMRFAFTEAARQRLDARWGAS